MVSPPPHPIIRLSSVLLKYKKIGTVVKIGIHPSNVKITKLKIDKDRQSILDRRDKTKQTPKGKVAAKDIPVAQ